MGNAQRTPLLHLARARRSPTWRCRRTTACWPPAAPTRSSGSGVSAQLLLLPFLVGTVQHLNRDIYEIAVLEGNRLLAAGSTDKIIWVWCLSTAAPLAVLGSYSTFLGLKGVGLPRSPTWRCRRTTACCGPLAVLGRYCYS